MKELNKMQLISAWVTVAGALVAVYVYFDNKRDKEQKQEILGLEKQIKELELANQVHLAKHNGLM
jgi:Tfp pilus assembly protein PilN